MQRLDKLQIFSFSCVLLKLVQKASTLRIMMFERFKLIPRLFAVYSLLYIHMSFMFNIDEMQFRSNSGIQGTLLQKDAFNFKCIPLTKSSPDDPKLKNESLHLETLKTFNALPSHSLKFIIPDMRVGEQLFPIVRFPLITSGKSCNHELLQRQ